MKEIIIPIILLAFCGCQHAQQKKPSEMLEYSKSTRKEMQRSRDFSEQKYKETLDTKYDAMFGEMKPAMGKYSGAALKQVFKMYDTLSFYTLEDRHLTGMEEAFHELQKRNLEKASCVEGGDRSTCVDDMFSAYITQGQLSRAKKVKNEYPEILSKEQLPDVREPAEYLGKPGSLYTVSPDGKYLDLEPVDIKNRPVMVAIMSTDCHFSRHILKSVMATPELKSDFEKYAVIVLPINASLSFIPEVVRWNNENPKLPFRIHSGRRDLQAGWEKFDFTSIPQFIFLNNGEIVDYIGGWGPTDEEFAAKLKSGFEKLKSEQKE